ncbi:MAG TPA: Eco57I restriction-modification methylase domain-containing protein [Verrucomicrobiae bacterium]
MKSHTPVLVALAKLYAASKAGRTGAGQRDILVDFKELLSQAGCQDGEDRDTAIRQLRELDGSILFLEGPRRDSDIIHQVRLPPTSEAKLFALLGIPSPTNRRETMARQFSEASLFEVPGKWRASWQKVCGELSEAALQGGAMTPFSRDDLNGNAELLNLVPRLLVWQQQDEESLLRFASCVLTGNSKRLGELAAEGPDGRLIGKLGAILDRVTSGEIRSLEDVGISQSPRFALVHGPLRLLLDNEWLDLGVLRGPARFSGTDISRASQMETSALRCLTVENETSFHELAKLNSGELLVCTSYPVDNRSTATTILAVRSLIELQADRDLKTEARKLLSFTDNRQDASLQAGHFNDFAQVALLRSALHKATQQRRETGLSHGELSRAVFEAMQLRFDEYAADPEVRGPAKNATNDALRRVIDYYLYRDLQRGWRVTAPNLEDCGLLVFDYAGLKGPEGLLDEAELWNSGFDVQVDREEKRFVEVPAPLRSCKPELREELLRTLLDVLRRSLAVKVDVLDPQKQLDLVEQTKPRLLEDTVWYLEDARELAKSMVAYPRPKQREDRTGFFVSSYGSFGRYLKRSLVPHVPSAQNFGRPEVDQVIRFLLLALINPMAVELCKVTLWLEALEPGKPLSFLDHHIRCGNSLLGATPELIAAGLPDEAFDPIEGDDKAACSSLKKLNRAQREGLRHLFVAEDNAIRDRLWQTASAIEEMGDSRPEDIQRKEAAFRAEQSNYDFQKAWDLANLWCAAFVIQKRFPASASEIPDLKSEVFASLDTQPLATQGGLFGGTEELPKAKIKKTKASRRTNLENAIGITTQHLRDFVEGAALTDGLTIEAKRLAAEYKFFHWHLAFPEVSAHGGFDVFLGNPPWVRQELFKSIKNLLAVYASFRSTADISVFFLELSVRLLSTSGRSAILTPNKWFRAAYGDALRRYLRNSARLHLVIDFGHSKNLFRDADTFPACLVLSRVNSAVTDDTTLRFVRAFDEDRRDHSLQELIASYHTEVSHRGLSDVGWVFNDPDVEAVLNTMRTGGKQLAEVIGSSPLYGLKTGFNDAFYLSDGMAQQVLAEEPESAALIRPFVRGRDVKRWKVHWEKQWHIVIPSSQNRRWPWTDAGDEDEAESIFAATHPVLHSHLKKFETQLRNRTDQGTYWWELRSCDYYEKFATAKIVVSRISFHSACGLDSVGYFQNDSTVVIPSSDLFILAVLNSRVAWWYAELERAALTALLGLTTVSLRAIENVVRSVDCDLANGTTIPLEELFQQPGGAELTPEWHEAFSRLSKWAPDAVWRDASVCGLPLRVQLEKLATPVFNPTWRELPNRLPDEAAWRKFGTAFWEMPRSSCPETLKESVLGCLRVPGNNGTWLPVADLWLEDDSPTDSFGGLLKSWSLPYSNSQRQACTAKLRAWGLYSAWEKRCKTKVREELAGVFTVSLSNHEGAPPFAAVFSENFERSRRGLEDGWKLIVSDAEKTAIRRFVDARQRELKLSGKTLLSPAIPAETRDALMLHPDFAAAPAWATEDAWQRILRLGLSETCNFEFLDEKGFRSRKAELAKGLLEEFHNWKDKAISESARTGLESLFSAVSSRQRSDWYVALSSQKRRPLREFFAGLVTTSPDDKPAERLMARCLSRAKLHADPLPPPLDAIPSLVEAAINLQKLRVERDGKGELLLEREQVEDILSSEADALALAQDSIPLVGASQGLRLNAF